MGQVDAGDLLAALRAILNELTGINLTLARMLEEEGALKETLKESLRGIRDQISHS